MPVEGGTTEKLSNEFCPHFKNSYRSLFRLNSILAFRSNASFEPYSSTCTEWSITSSTGERGLILVASPPKASIASRIAARSTTAGTPVKSCNRTREGVNAISVEGSAFGSHCATAWMSLLVISTPSSNRSKFSSSIFCENGSRVISKCSPSFGKE